MAQSIFSDPAQPAFCAAASNASFWFMVFAFSARFSRLARGSDRSLDVLGREVINAFLRQQVVEAQAVCDTLNRGCDVVALL